MSSITNSSIPENATKNVLDFAYNTPAVSISGRLATIHSASTQGAIDNVIQQIRNDNKLGFFSRIIDFLFHNSEKQNARDQLVILAIAGECKKNKFPSETCTKIAESIKKMGSLHVGGDCSSIASLEEAAAVALHLLQTKTKPESTEDFLKIWTISNLHFKNEGPVAQVSATVKMNFESLPLQVTNNSSFNINDLSFDINVTDICKNHFILSYMLSDSLLPVWKKKCDKLEERFNELKATYDRDKATAENLEKDIKKTADNFSRKSKNTTDNIKGLFSGIDSDPASLCNTRTRVDIIGNGLTELDTIKELFCQLSDKKTANNMLCYDSLRKAKDQAQEVKDAYTNYEAMAMAYTKINEFLKKVMPTRQNDGISQNLELFQLIDNLPIRAKIQDILNTNTLSSTTALMDYRRVCLSEDSEVNSILNESSLKYTTPPTAILAPGLSPEDSKRDLKNYVNNLTRGFELWRGKFETIANNYEITEKTTTAIEELNKIYHELQQIDNPGIDFEEDCVNVEIAEPTKAEIDGFEVIDPEEIITQEIPVNREQAKESQFKELQIKFDECVTKTKEDLNKLNAADVDNIIMSESIQETDTLRTNLFQLAKPFTPFPGIYFESELDYQFLNTEDIPDQGSPSGKSDEESSAPELAVETYGKGVYTLFYEKLGGDNRIKLTNEFNETVRKIENSFFLSGKTYANYKERVQGDMVTAIKTTIYNPEPTPYSHKNGM